jgi:hypothetical protein
MAVVNRLHYLAASMLLLGVACNSKPINLAGDWNGVIQMRPQTLRSALHITGNSAGGLSATFDSIDQSAMGIPCDDVVLKGNDFSFAIPAAHGTYQGTLSADGKTITGTWSQGVPLPLVFARQSSAPAGDPAIAGDWSGPLKVPAVTLHLALHVSSLAQGGFSVAMDSLDQGAMGLAGSNVTLNGNEFSFEIPLVRGSYRGTVSADAKTIKGVWGQGTSTPLDFTRQT